jgi:hypothetical protein
MEEHPDCQPRRTVTVNRCDDDDGDRDKDFERKRIDDSTPIAFSAALCGSAFICENLRLSYSTG